MSSLPPSTAKPVIGLVGGVGAGKSTAAAELVALGCRLVDADRIGHELLADEQVRTELRQRWGQDIFGPDGQVDRKALAAIVFEDPRELAALNGILHPRIRRRMEEQIAEALADPSAAGVAVDAAILLEAGWDDLCTHRLFISAPSEFRRRRAVDLRGWSEADWRRREKSQNPLDNKARRCDYEVDNRSSVPCLREQIRQIFQRICADLA